MALTNAHLALRCQKSAALNAAIADALGDVRSSKPRGRLALSAISLAHEHHSGFLRLMDTEHFASAAALLRPIAEASACAHWISYVASKDWIQKATTDQPQDPPTLDRMIRALAKAGIPLEGIKGLVSLLQTPIWKRYHSFTHGGIEQLARRGDLVTFDEDANLANMFMADVFVLAGAAISTIWSGDVGLRDFIAGEYSSINEEISQRSGSPPQTPWTGLPPPI